MAKYEPIGGRVMTKPFMVFSLLTLIAAVIIVWRFVAGLDATTNMNDGYPFGIWVVVDMVIGTGFGCGGFVVAFLIYILNKGEYSHVMRAAILISLFGYALGGLSILIDLGRYWQFYNMLLPWYMQFNSVLLEVALCVTAYVLVLAIEFSPILTEKFGMDNLRFKLDRWMFLVMALGVLLPVMHQSSLGTLIVGLGHQVSPLWQTELSPLLFLATAVTMGYAAVVFEAVLASLRFGRPMESTMLGKLSWIMAIILALFLVVRFADLALRGQVGLAFAGDLNGNLFLLENLFFLVPVALLATSAGRHNIQLIFLAAVSGLAGGILQRLDAFLIGYDPGNGWQYFPSVPEIMVTVGLISFEIAAYLFIVKKLPVLHSVKRG